MTKFRRVVLIVGLSVAILVVIAMIGPPVLLRVPTLNSSIRDEPALVVLNPVRDRAPELRADELLQRLRMNQCDEVLAQVPVDEDRRAYLCEKQREHPLVSWKLIDRQDRSGEVKLMYSQMSGTPELPGDLVLVMYRSGAGEWLVKYISFTY